MSRKGLYFLINPSKLFRDKSSSPLIFPFISCLRENTTQIAQGTVHGWGIQAFEIDKSMSPLRSHASSRELHNFYKNQMFSFLKRS